MRRPRAALGIVASLGLALLASARVRETALGFVNNYTARYTQTYATASRTHAALTSAAMPAGGVGAAAGAWDTAANRDQAIAEFAALRTDVTNVKNLVNAVIDDLQAFKIIG